MFIVYDGVPTFKLLGVWQQENLRWNHHINETVKKANQRLHYLRDCRKAQLPPDVHGHYSIQYEDPPTVRIIRLSSMGRWIPRLPRKGNQASSEQKSRHHRRPQGHASSNRTKRRRDEAAKVELQRILADKKHPNHAFVKHPRSYNFTLRSSAKLSMPFSETTRFYLEPAAF